MNTIRTAFHRAVACTGSPAALGAITAAAGLALIRVAVEILR